MLCQLVWRGRDCGVWFRGWGLGLGGEFVGVVLSSANWSGAAALCGLGFRV